MAKSRTGARPRWASASVCGRWTPPGEAVAVGELWPFGRRNVPPGRHEISFDRWIGHDPEIVDFQAIVTGVVAWPE
ncbi:MAG: hypothetical protein IPK20_20465 [Betaproteobacteria bacterium]|nr:hypothetical protein [Betaproteobacteria bacterium]